jgi:hypothetical protein
MSRRRLSRILFWGFFVVAAAIAAGGFILPKELKVTRSATIRAAPATVFDKLQNLKQWESWGPWFRRERFIDLKFDGPESGAGAMMAWKSDSEGQGRLKIVSAAAPRSIDVAVKFDEGPSANLAFALRAAGEEATEVTVDLESDFGMNPGRRYFALFARGAVARDLDEALENLKALLEEQAPPPTSPSKL